MHLAMDYFSINVIVVKRGRIELAPELVGLLFRLGELLTGRPCERRRAGSRKVSRNSSKGQG